MFFGMVSISKDLRTFERYYLWEIFSFINFMFVTRKWKNKSSPDKLVTWSKFYFFNLELV